MTGMVSEATTRNYPRISASDLTALERSVGSMQTVTAATESIDDFFARYTGYLTDGNIEGLAAVYNYPSLAVTAMGCASPSPTLSSPATSSPKVRTSTAVAESKAYVPATS
jgi:hypothetical protein